MVNMYKCNALEILVILSEATAISPLMLSRKPDLFHELQSILRNSFGEMFKQSMLRNTVRVGVCYGMVNLSSV